MAAPPPRELAPGERIGRYAVVRRLALGGMAEVYLARHEGLKGFSKLVVIKRVLRTLEAAEKFNAMFLDEGRLAARLSHPSIAQTFELGEHDGALHMVMEYVPGESLNRIVRRANIDKKPIPPGSVLRVAMQVLEALEYAHELKGDRGEWLKVVHRDVSPTNVVVTYHGGVKLLDFGIARALTHEHHTQIGTVKGKGGYMSPEQAMAGVVDQRTDLYAVGSLLYLMTTGVGPFDGQEDVFAMMRAAVEARFPRPSNKNPAIHPQLEALILKAMAQRADDRFPTAGAMLAALEDFAADQRLFPSPRELTSYMRTLFPERAELARSYEQPPDAAMVAKLAESFSDVDSQDIVATPTKLARPKVASKPDEPMLTVPARLPRDPLETEPRGETIPVAQRQTRPPRRTLEELTPLHGGKPLGESAPSLSTVRGGPVPVGAASERRTQQAAALAFPPDESDEKTAGAVDFPLPMRTITGEGPGAEEATNTGVPGPPRRTASLADMKSVGDLVAANPWAFLIAGLAAVLLGVAVLWALGGD